MIKFDVEKLNKKIQSLKGSTDAADEKLDSDLANLEG